MSFIGRISARQDWDCEVALERRAIALMDEINRLNRELVWTLELMRPSVDSDDDSDEYEPRTDIESSHCLLDCIACIIVSCVVFGIVIGIVYW